MSRRYFSATRSEAPPFHKKMTRGLNEPPKVEYGLTHWGQALCPALDALLKWAAQRIAP
jgi:DNA-binding HxlR family transcriptional regulator